MRAHCFKFKNNFNYTPVLALPLPRTSFTHHQRASKFSTTPCAFHIDHRHHLNLAWERQKEQDRILSPEAINADLTGNAVVPVQNLTHLEALLDAAGGRLVVLALYSTSCGICKELRSVFGEVCVDSHKQRARTVFMEHDVNDEFDFPSDLARYYRIKSVPRFLFFIDGALVRTMNMADVRGLRTTRAEVQQAMHSEQHRLRDVLFELLVKNAPSARR